jgi:hypothetical protein
MRREVLFLIQQLGEGIHASISESQKIVKIVEALRMEGFTVMLLLEANVGLSPLEPPPLRNPTPLVGKDGAIAPGAFSRDDLAFFKRLRINPNPPPK